MERKETKKSCPECHSEATRVVTLSETGRFIKSHIYCEECGIVEDNCHI